VDSAAIVAAMKLRSNEPPTTFTIGFPGHGDVLDERAPAAETARIVGTDHRDTVMHETDFLAELARCVPRLEEPCGIPSAPALLQLSRFAANDVKVVLAGQGADEPHGGYGRHQAAAVLRPLRLVPASAATPAAAIARALPRAAAARRVAHLLGGRGDDERLLRLMEITDSEARSALAGPGAEAEQERLRAARRILADVPDRGLLEQALYLDTHMFLPDGILLCNDKMSMAAGLELRVPFLDLELMRFVERIPASARIQPRRPKLLHRRATRRLLPPEVTDRRKHGFATPYDDWLRASLGQEVARRYAPGSPLGELVDPVAAARLVDEHRRGRADHKSVLYCLLELSEWHAAFVEAREPVAA
jgi:asparagine synthase (glutamine-hydrolysing)